MTYYVATLASYVLVEAENEIEAREMGITALQELYPERTEPFQIRVVRPATEDEKQFIAWHEEKLRIEN